MEDHLAAELLIIEHVKASVPELRAVYGACDLAKLGDSAVTTPSAHVIYDGEDFVGEAASKNAARMVAQRWLIVIAINSSREAVSGAGARASAGTLMSKVIKACSGHKLGAGFREMKRIPPPAAEYNGTFAYFPLAFEVNFTESGT